MVYDEKRSNTPLLNFISSLAYWLLVVVLLGAVFVFSYNCVARGACGFYLKSIEPVVERAGEQFPQVQKAGRSILEFIARPEEFAARQSSWESTIETNKDNYDLGVKVSNFGAPRIFGSGEKVVVNGVVSAENLTDEICPKKGHR